MVAWVRVARLVSPGVHVSTICRCPPLRIDLSATSRRYHIIFHINNAIWVALAIGTCTHGDIYRTEIILAILRPRRAARPRTSIAARTHA